MIPVRLERTTHSLEGCCSIQLSYGTKILRTQFRTHDPSRSLGLLYPPDSYRDELRNQNIKNTIPDSRPIPIYRDCSILPIAIGMSYGTKILKHNSELTTHPDRSGLLYPPDSYRDELRNQFPPQNYIFFQFLQPQF